MYENSHICTYVLCNITCVLESFFCKYFLPRIQTTLLIYNPHIAQLFGLGLFFGLFIQERGVTGGHTARCFILSCWMYDISILGKR